MNTLKALVMGQINRGNELMVFDWDRAARRIIEVHPKSAWAGLSGDWGWTGGEIYCDGKPIKSEYTFLASTWATPELDMDGNQNRLPIFQPFASKSTSTATMKENTPSST